jgi:hypothetical protein
MAAMTSASRPDDASTTEAAVVDASPPTAISRRRVRLIYSLVALASVIGLLSILTTWVNRQMLDKQAWRTASSELIRDPKVQSALSVYFVNQLYDNVDVSAQLENELPPNLKPLAAPVAAALREPSARGVSFLLGRPRVQQLFINASSVAQQRLINVVENKTGFGIATGNGNVTVDLNALLTQLGANLGLPSSALDRLPPNVGVLTVMKSDQLSAAQTGVRLVKVLSVWLLVLVLAMFGLAIYLAHGFRREVLRTIGWCFIGVGLVVLVLRRVVGNYAIDGLTEAQYRTPAHHVWLVASSILGQIGAAVILYGVVAVLGALLAGPGDAATTVRRWIAPILVGRPGIAWTAVGFAYLLLVLWGGTHALRTWWGVLVLGGLVALGVAALQRQTAREFPSQMATG